MISDFAVLRDRARNALRGTLGASLIAGLVLAFPHSVSAQGGARITGAAISKVGKDTRKLTVTAADAGDRFNSFTTARPECLGSAAP